MNLRDKIRTKIPGASDYYNQKGLIWRNRGESTALEIVDAVRILYDDKPNVHELSTGETIPAVPKDYVQNLYGQGSYFCAVEGNDNQLVIFKPKFDLDAIPSDESLEDQDIEIESDMPSKEIKNRLEDKNYDVVSFASLDNRDERFTFLSNEIETANDKYNPSSLLFDNINVVLPVVAAVAVAIVMYTMTGEAGEHAELKPSSTAVNA